MAKTSVEGRRFNQLIANARAQKHKRDHGELSVAICWLGPKAGWEAMLVLEVSGGMFDEVVEEKVVESVVGTSAQGALQLLIDKVGSTDQSRWPSVWQADLRSRR